MYYDEYSDEDLDDYSDDYSDEDSDDLDDYNSYLKAALQSDDTKIIEMLIKRDKITKQMFNFDDSWYTPFSYAIQCGSFNVAKLLVSWNHLYVTSTRCMPHKRTPIMHLADNWKENESFIEFLISQGALKEHGSFTLLFCRAVATCNDKSVDWLLGFTNFKQVMTACQKAKDMETSEQISKKIQQKINELYPDTLEQAMERISAGDDPNFIEWYGTPLHLAAMIPSQGTVKYLLSLPGIDCSIEHKGNTPAEVASNDTIRELILKSSKELESRQNKARENNNIQQEIDKTETEIGLLNGQVDSLSDEVDNLNDALRDLLQEINTKSNELKNKQSQIAVAENRMKALRAKLRKGGDFNNNTEQFTVDRRTIECPLCFEVPRSPKKILQCENGHIMCEECRDECLASNCHTCPSCRVSLQKMSRAIVLEKIVTEIQAQRNTFDV